MDMMDHIWKAISPFSTCVGMDFLVAKNLHAAPEKAPGFAKYRENIKTVACLASSDSEIPFHCVTAIFLDQCCIVIDFIFSAKGATPKRTVLSAVAKIINIRTNQRRNGKTIG